MKKLTVKTKFFITRTNDGEIYANEGDILTVKDKGAEHFNIVKLNDKNIFSIWQRKKWVLAKCK